LPQLEFSITEDFLDDFLELQDEASEMLEYEAVLELDRI
jgi:hypothetical protein